MNTPGSATIRRRPGAFGFNQPEPDTPKSSGGRRTEKVLKQMDVFTKVHDEFKVRLESCVRTYMPLLCGGP
jgi:hypothetical protein